MTETTRAGNASQSGGIDLTQFYQVFFEEANENLASMETLLLGVDVLAPVDEDLHAIFRAAHSIKGGSATFGFADVAELTHELETLLDRVRKHELALSTHMVDVLLEAGDILKAQLARHQAGGTGESLDTVDLVARIRKIAAGENETALPVISTRDLVLDIGPVANDHIQSDLQELFDDIPGLGSMQVVATEGLGEGVYRFSVKTKSTDTELLDLFSFHVGREQVKISEIGVTDVSNSIVALPVAADDGFGFFVAPGEHRAKVQEKNPEAVAPKVEAPVAAARNDRSNNHTSDAMTLRVPVEKVDQLINLVGELVITQAMLTMKGKLLDPIESEGLLAGLGDLERNTRGLQDAVMSIRMIPMAVVFNRFPRMIRDLAAKLGKQVELKTSGEATELDKGLIEKITDPLTHLVRNSVDHGIESAAQRQAAGKPAQGTITLTAAHQGGSIVIEVRDDGAGLDRERILAKAREKDIDVRDSMTDQEVWALIFAPGFSTADVVTDVSGRGVGMDVVRRNINALGGVVEIDSAKGYGTRISVRLPLTLAIMDGLSVGVGDEIYIIPIGSVVESFQATDTALKTLGGTQQVVDVRGQYLPVIAIDELFQVRRFDLGQSARTTVVVETDGARVALLVDELIGQHQVVVKNLETNYKKVPGISGATIMGDGHVALILDVNALVKRTRH